MGDKKIAIGVDNFKKLLDNGNYYVDKTLLVKDIIESSAEVLLITRPRRFGKTLNMSMLKYFYEIPECRQFERENVDVSYLFHGLHISKYEKYWKQQGKYPVIFLTLKGAKNISWEETHANLVKIISNEYKRHKYLLETDILDYQERELYQKIINIETTDSDYTDVIFSLSSYLERYYKEKVMVIIDEYDTPIQAGYINGYYKEIINFMKSMLGKGLKGNNSLKQGVLTGIMKVAKESIFSDFNNPRIYTVVTNDMSDKFGFTEEEVQELLESRGLEDKKEEVKAWYNGYVFGLETTIYNPWSILNYVVQPEMGVRPYWINTSANLIIKEVMQLDKVEGKKVVQDLLEKRPVGKEIAENVIYETIKTNPDSAWSFLLHAGYLKTTIKRRIDDVDRYSLEIPNTEVSLIYKAMLKNYFKDDFRISTKVNHLVIALKDHDEETFAILLEELYLKYVSYNDVKLNKGEQVDLSEEKEKQENFHHGFILGLMMFAVEHYEIKSNREYGLGRPDIVLIPKEPKKSAYVFEFKWASRKSKKTLDYLVEQASKQIKDEKYVEGIRKTHHVDHVIKVPIGFKGKELKMRYLTN